MPATRSNAFLENLEKADLLGNEQLDLARKLAEKLDDPKALAREAMKRGLLTRWQASMVLAGKTKLSLGKYLLLEQLSSGASGQMFLAEHRQMGRRVVLRTLSKVHTRDPDAIKRFLAEARQIASLDHRNLIHVFDVDSDENRYYLVTEYVEGQDLARIVTKRGPREAEDAVNYLCQAAEGLAHAHEKGIVHGAVRPGKLIVDENRIVKVIDVGIVGLAHGSDEQHGDYAAPEVDAGGIAAPAADIYALGRVGMFLLTGAPSRNGAAVEAELDSILQKMAAAEVGKRYGTAAEAAAALRKWLDEHSGAAATPTAAAAGPGTSKPPIKKPAGENGRDAKKSPLPSRHSKQEADPAALAFLDELPPAVADTEEFSLDIGDKKPATPPLKTAAALPQQQQQPASAKLPPVKRQEAAAATADAPAPASPAKKPLPLPLPVLIGIGGGAAALLLLIVVAVVVAMFVFRDDGSGAVAKPRNNKNAVTKQSLPDPELDPEADPEADPEGDADPPDDPSDEGGAPVADDGAAAPPEDGSDPPQDISDPPPAVPAADPVPEEPPTTEETPADPPAAPADPPQPKPKPKKPPFGKLASLVTLPAPGGEAAPAPLEPVELGPLFLADDDLFFVSLLGGENAYRAGYEFSLDNRPSSERDWELFVNRGADGKLKIAELSARDDKLIFLWMAEAVEEEAAPYLRNCLLKMRTGNFEHQLALREPVAAEPLPVDINETNSKGEYSFDYPPDASAVFVEISTEGFPEAHSIEPQAKMETNGGELHVRLGDIRENVLSLKVESVMRRGTSPKVQITASPVVKVEGQREQRYVAKEAEKGLVERQQFLVLAQQRVEALNQQLQKIKDNKQKQPLQQTIQAANAQITLVQNQVAELTKLKDQAAALGQGAKLHVRVYYEAGDQQVELVRTAPPKK